MHKIDLNPLHYLAWKERSQIVYKNERKHLSLWNSGNKELEELWPLISEDNIRQNID
jgi:hypothetical protein